MKDFLNKPQVKNIFLAVPGIISVLCSAFGDWNMKVIAFWVKAVSAIILFLIYIALLVFKAQMKEELKGYWKNR